MRDKNRGNADWDGERRTKTEEEKEKKLYEEEGKVRFWERREAGYRLFFFFVKVQMSGWQAARSVQPKNLFNVCFTG